MEELQENLETEKKRANEWQAAFYQEQKKVQQLMEVCGPLADLFDETGQPELKDLAAALEMIARADRQAYGQ